MNPRQNYDGVVKSQNFEEGEKLFEEWREINIHMKQAVEESETFMHLEVGGERRLLVSQPSRTRRLWGRITCE